MEGVTGPSDTERSHDKKEFSPITGKELTDELCIHQTKPENCHFCSKQSKE